MLKECAKEYAPTLRISLMNNKLLKIHTTYCAHDVLNTRENCMFYKFLLKDVLFNNDLAPIPLTEIIASRSLMKNAFG